MIQRTVVRLHLVSVKSFFTSIEKQAKIASYTLNKDKPFLNHIAEYERYLEPDISFKESELNSHELIEGFATEYGTQNFVSRTLGKLSKAHFRMPYDGKLSLSSIGIGTYIGPPDTATDFSMYNAIKESILSGAINFIDTGNLL